MLEGLDGFLNSYIQRMSLRGNVGENQSRLVPQLADLTYTHTLVIENTHDPGSIVPNFHVP